jgi:hypothetical protein
VEALQRSDIAEVNAVMRTVYDARLNSRVKRFTHSKGE